MSSFANYWIITKTSSRREPVIGIHGCAYKVSDSLRSLAQSGFMTEPRLRLFLHCSANAKLGILPIKPSNGEF